MSTDFDIKIARWQEYQDTPWGRLFYNISQENLHPYLPEQPYRILDIGGGNGRTAIAYAKLGQKITLLDTSAEMLSAAQHYARQAEVSEQIEFHQADLVEIPALFDENTFDVILCHNVLAYVDDIAEAIRAICHCLQANGILSLISMNRYSEAYREILQQLNPQAAIDNLAAKTYTSVVFNTSIKLYSADDIIELLRAEGFSVLGQYGVRCVSDYIPDNEIKEDPAFFAQLERLEKAMSGQFPYYLLARFFQIIARKTFSA